MRRLSFAAAWALLLIGIGCLGLSERTSAFWQSRDSNYNVAISGGGGSYTGPGDLVSSASAWWGLRGYSAAYSTGSNSAAVVCDAATFLTCTTINILSNGKFDTATASGSSSCSSTCVVKSLTDQTGNGFTISCASASVCPTLTFNCINSTLPCMTFAGAQGLFIASGPSISQPYSTSTVAIRTATFTSQNSIVWPPNGGLTLFQSAANTAAIYAGTLLTATASDSNWHSVQAVFNGASSDIVIDGSATSGSAGTGTTNGSWGIGANNSVTADFLTGKITEVGAWPVGFNATQYGNLCHNQFTFWGTSTSC